MKNTHSRSAFCHVQYSFSEIVLIHIIKFYTTHSFVWRKNNFCSTYPLRGTLKLSKSGITECTSEWYVFIRWWLVGVRNGPGNWMRGIDQISRGQPLSRRAFPGLISQISKVTTKQNLKYHSLKFHPCRSELNYLFLGVIFHNEREIEIQKEMGEDTEVVDRYMYIYQ